MSTTPSSSTKSNVVSDHIAQHGTVKSLAMWAALIIVMVVIITAYGIKRRLDKVMPFYPNVEERAAMLRRAQQSRNVAPTAATTTGPSGTVSSTAMQTTTPVRVIRAKGGVWTGFEVAGQFSICKDSTIPCSFRVNENPQVVLAAPYSGTVSLDTIGEKVIRKIWIKPGRDMVITVYSR